MGIDNEGDRWQIADDTSCDRGDSHNAPMYGHRLEADFCRTDAAGANWPSRRGAETTASPDRVTRWDEPAVGSPIATDPVMIKTIEIDQ